MQQTVFKVEEKKDSRVVLVLKVLWMPALVLLTVVTGYHFPYSLAISVALLLWSTKPKANSIYDWVEKVGHLSIFQLFTLVIHLHCVAFYVSYHYPMLNVISHSLLYKMCCLFGSVFKLMIQ